MRTRRTGAVLAAVLVVSATLTAVAPPADATVTFASTAATAGRYGTAHIARAGVAVYDRQTGQLIVGGQAYSQVSAASTVKAFIAADLLYRNAHRSITLSSYDYGRMTTMITRSDNSSADYLWHKYGQELIVRHIIARYSLTETAPSPVAGFWGFTRMTAHDFALFLGRAANDPGVGPWLTTAMSHSEHYVNGFNEWFGIPASGIRPFAIKQGWTCCDTGDIMNSTGYVGANWRYAIAIFTSGAATNHRTYIDEIAKLLLPGGYVPGDPSRNPFGHVDTAKATGSTVTLSGWTVDPDRTSSAVTVDITEGTHLIYRAPTAGYRADINSRYDIRGYHGYSGHFSATNGRHTYCVVYENLAYGSGNTRTCLAITVNGSPRGALETSAPQPDGSVAISGWAFDPDATAQSLNVLLYDNGAQIKTLATTVPRPDVNLTYKITGNHGYATNLAAVPDGTHLYCIYAVNVGPAAPNTNLGCRTVLVHNNPYGALETATGSTGQIHVTGWAIDPNEPATSVTVQISVDGQQATLLTTDVTRTDINTTNNVTGNHGFDATLPAPAGTHTLAVTIVNVDGGTDVQLPLATTTTT